VTTFEKMEEDFCSLCHVLLLLLLPSVPPLLLFIYELTPPQIHDYPPPLTPPPYKIHAWLNPIGIPQTSSQSQSVLARESL
jgi:hypothetical protein